MSSSADDPSGSESQGARSPGEPVDSTRAVDSVSDAGSSDAGGMPGMSVARPEGDGSKSAGLGHAAPMVEGYQITRLISRGGQGAVYQAVQNSTRRKVAIKVLLESWSDSASARKRFEREVELVAHLKHPNIITVFDSGTTADGRLFYVMDYVRGEAITAYVKEHHLDLPAALELFATVCDAVNHAHQKGVIHRDLKPSNILVDTEGQVHILDFGLAKAITERVEPLATVSGQVLGTPAYMSPEQAGGKLDAIDTRSDVYCLGIILYELLTGRFPYPVTGTLVETAKHIEQTSPMAPTAAWSGEAGISPRSGLRLRSGKCPLDVEIETIVLKALAKERDRRYQSAGELARDIRHYLAGRPIEARRDSTMYVLRKTLARYRGAVMAGVGFIALLGLSSIVFFVQRQEARQARREAIVQRDHAQEASDEAKRNLVLAEQRLAESLDYSGDAVLARGKGMEARQRYYQAWDLQKKLGISEYPAIAGVLESAQIDPPPLMGDEGYRAGIGGLTGHIGSIVHVVFLPDGRHALSCAADRTVRLWDIATGREIRQFVGHTHVVFALAVLPGGKQFASASLDKTLKLWSTDSNRELGTFSGHTDGVVGVAVTPDGKTVISSSLDGTIRLWNIATKEQVKQFDYPGVQIWNIALSRDGQWLLMCGYKPANRGELFCRVRNLQTGAEETDLPVFQLGQFLPDASQVLGVPADYTNDLILWDRTKHQEIRRFRGQTGVITDLCISADGKTALTCASDHLVKMWSIESAQALRTFAGHMDVVRSVDGCRIWPAVISGGTDTKLKLWDGRLASMDLPIVSCPDRPPILVAFSPDGWVCASGSGDGVVRVWDAWSGYWLASTKSSRGGITSMAFSPDGTRIACGFGRGDIQAWELSGMKELNSFRAETEAVVGLAFSADGKSLLASSGVGMPRWWSIENGRDLGRLPGPQTRTTALAVNPERTMVAAMADGGRIPIWSLPDGPMRHAFTVDTHAAIRSLAFSRDGKFLVGGDLSGAIYVFDVVNRKPVGESPSQGVAGVGFIGDGKAFVAGCTDNALRLFDTAGRKVLHAFGGHQKQISSLAVSPDGMRVLTAAHDWRLAMWDFSRPQHYRDFEALLPEARKALDRNPGDPGALLAFARWHYFRGAWWWAAELFEECRAAGGKVPSVDLARCYWQLNRLDKAKAEFTRAMEQKEAPREYLAMCLGAVETAAMAPAQAQPVTRPTSGPATRP